VNKQISRVALASLVLLGSLIVATTYWQTWATGGLAARQDNAIKQVAQFTIRRGKIYAANGRTVLATNVRKRANGQTLYFRTYPTHGFASQVVGYSTQGRSRAGLEREENAYLTASDKNLSTILDRLGDEIRGATITGNDIVTTPKPGPQRLAERLLEGKCGAAVVMNPKTGAIYVMASAPTYDPNLIEKPAGYAKIQATRAPCAPSAPLLNRATQGLYAPGSTFKVVTAAAALESGKYTPDSTFQDPGYCELYGKRVFNAGNADARITEAFGTLNLVTALEHSVNSVFCNIGKAIGAGAILDQAKRFGFYSTPPLETPSDARSGSGLYKGNPRKLTYPKDPATQVDPGRLAFGQEALLTTPLQMAMVASGIANRGIVMRPRLVKRVIAPDGGVVAKLRPRQYSRALGAKNADAIRDMMVAAVKSGTGTRAQIEGVTVAGKTGTAETGRPGVYHTWFIFFAPAENPVLAGAVVVESQANGFGGTVAAPIAKELMQAILPPTSNGT
jgi:penicillin-binding protein A